VQRVPDDGDASLDDRVGALATWLGEIAERVRTTELATGDEKTAKELRRAIEALAKHDPKLESRLTDRIDVLADRLGTLASAVSTTSAALARRDGELAALRRGLDQGNARIHTLGDELGRAASAAEIAVLSKTIATLSADRPTRKDGEQTDRLAGKVDYLTERVDTLAKTVAATAAGLAGRDGELATLRRRLDEREKHFEQAFVELRQRRGEITLDGRLDTLERTLETVAERLPLLESEIGAVRARIDEASRQVGSTVTELQQSTANVSAHVAAAEARSHASEKALEKHAASLSGTVGDLAARFDSVVAGVESSLAGLAAELVDRQGTADREVTANSRRNRPRGSGRSRQSSTRSVHGTPRKNSTPSSPNVCETSNGKLWLPYPRSRGCRRHGHPNSTRSRRGSTRWLWSRRTRGPATTRPTRTRRSSCRS